MALLLGAYVTWVIYYGFYMATMRQNSDHIIWPSQLSELMTDVQFTSYCLSYFCFMLQHQVFAFAYLRVALIFKLAFSVKPELAQMEIKRRMTILWAMAAVIFVLTILPWLVLPFFGSNHIT